MALENGMVESVCEPSQTAMLDAMALRVAAVQSVLVEQGFTLACAKANDIEQSVFFGLALIRVKCNGDESWNANPWVWVVEFKRVQP